ncbi:hypothetical protein JCM14202_1377 [Agrilactobacillus composti DSM 18527 = JCM 14202]|nr:hypothetical protein [Agrilactobacillus composti]GAF39512.1 hypothetical protein JCM14202_1377 [Agrilactobacillus composti DSM 18527 = JCM 14202]
MLYNLAVKNFKRYRVIHGIQISIGALAVMIMFDFSLMGADAKLMQVIGNTILSRSFLFLFTLVVAGLLILFSTYWNRLLMRQRYQEIGQLA